MFTMKRKFIFCVLIFSQFLIFSNEKFLSFTTGLSTGIPFYKEVDNEAENSDFHRIVIGTFGGINFNPIKQARFFVNVDLLADFNFNSNEYNNFLHISFPVGFKFYPNIGGLNFGTAYSLGIKANFSKNTKDGRKNSFGAWGNGFQFSVEYDFSYKSKYTFFPALGCKWTFMPRGNYYYDNLLTFYIAENF